jgi:hypothetical protein
MVLLGSALSCGAAGRAELRRGWKLGRACQRWPATPHPADPTTQHPAELKFNFLYCYSAHRAAAHARRNWAAAPPSHPAVRHVSSVTRDDGRRLAGGACAGRLAPCGRLWSLRRPAAPRFSRSSRSESLAMLGCSWQAGPAPGAIGSVRIGCWAC